MDPHEADDLHEEIEFSTRLTKADELEALGLAIPVGEHGRAKFLATAAEHWILRDEPDRARRALEAAGDGLPGELLVQPGAIWLMLDIRDGDPAQVDRRLADLLVRWRAGTMNESTCHMIGSLLEADDDLKRAHRWLTLPLTHLDLMDVFDLDDPVIEMCLVDRERVRRALGLAVDRLDALATSL